MNTAQYGAIFGILPWCSAIPISNQNFKFIYYFDMTGEYETKKTKENKNYSFNETENAKREMGKEKNR